MRYVSLFSGAEAATLAWGPLGWEPMAFAEIEPFPCAVLAFRFPEVENLGDVAKVDWEEFKREHGIPDVVVGGSPCQSFSIAGKREGLDGASGLMWEFVRACDQLRPRWVVWENVPGALSSSGGEDFRCLLQALDELGYLVAWRVLDAQFFGVAQRRRRVFLVGSLGGGRAAEVLLEPEGMRRGAVSSREKRAQIAARAGGGSQGAGGIRHRRGSEAGSVGFEPGLSPTVTAGWHVPAVVYGMAGNVEGRGARSGGNGLGFCDPDEAGMYTLTATDRPGVAVCMADTQAHSPVDEELCGTLTSRMRKDAPVVMTGTSCYSPVSSEVSGTITASSANDRPIAAIRSVVRRLTPLECERLQGMPDGWTKVSYRGRPADECPDGPRYKAIGNSMAVPVMRWIGRRIAEADAGWEGGELPCGDSE